MKLYAYNTYIEYLLRFVFFLGSKTKIETGIASKRCKRLVFISLYDKPAQILSLNALDKLKSWKKKVFLQLHIVDMVSISSHDVIFHILCEAFVYIEVLENRSQFHLYYVCII